MYEKRIILFLDILGFQEKLSNPEELVRAIRLLKDTLRPRDGEKKNTDFDFIQFSDLILISAKPALLASAVMFLLRVMLRVNNLVSTHGVSIRGSIVCGDYYYKDEILISPALAEAYKLESKFARYPRVLVSDSLTDFLDSLPATNPNRYDVFKHDYKNITLIDSDGFRYLNYLFATGAVETDGVQSDEVNLSEKIKQLDAHRRFVLKNLEEQNKNEIREKYIWMANYHNRYIDSDIFLESNAKENLYIDPKLLLLNY